MTDKNEVNLGDLARMLLTWGKYIRAANELEEAIHDDVLLLEESQQVGYVVASYSGGQKKYAYYATGQDAPTDVIKMHTKTVKTTDWRSVCLTIVELADIPFIKSDPSVSLKLIQ